MLPSTAIRNVDTTRLIDDSQFCGHSSAHVVPIEDTNSQSPVPPHSVMSHLHEITVTIEAVPHISITASADVVGALMSNCREIHPLGG